MPEDAASPLGLSRRDLLCAAAGAACLSASGAMADPVAGSSPAPVGLQRYDEVKPQEFPWGWIRWLMNGQIDPQAEMTLGMVHVEPKQNNPLHVHPNSAEYVHILSGTCEHLVGDRWVTLKKGDTLRIPKGVTHMARTGDQPFLAMILYDTPARQMVVVDAAK